jgi:hypothetical protein
MYTNGFERYRFFAGADHVKKPNIQEIIPRHAANSKQDRELRAFAKHLSQMNDKNRAPLIHMASKMVNRAWQRFIFSSASHSSAGEFLSRNKIHKPCFRLSA